MRLYVFGDGSVLSSSGYCYTSVSSPAIGFVKDTAEYIDIINETAHTISKFQTHNRQSGIFCGHIPNIQIIVSLKT